MDTNQNVNEDTLFVIEKNVPKTSHRGPHAVKDPKFFAVKATMEKMQRTDSFVFPLNGYKMHNIKSWVKKITKSMNDNILDVKIREKQPIYFSCLPIKTTLGEVTGARIYRDC